MPEMQTGTVYRLHDLLVKEVSMVDVPANERPFLIVKSDDMTNPTATTKTDENVDAALGAKAATETALLTAIHPEIQLAFGETLEKAGQRILALAGAVKSAKAADTEKPQIPAKLMEEVVNITAALGGLVGVDKAPAPPQPPGKKPPGAGQGQARPEGESTDDELPEGGSNVAGGKGKGKPQYKAEELDALVKSIATMEKLGDIDMSAMGMLYMTAGKEALRTAMDACYDGDYAKAGNYAGMAYKLLGKYTGGMSMDMTMAAKIDALHKQLGEMVENGVSKAGRKMSSARFAEFDKSIRALLELAEQVSPGYLESLGTVAKAAQPKLMRGLVELVRKQKAELAAATAARTESNANPVGEGSAAPEDKDPGWQVDMAADYNGEDFPADLKF